MAPFKGSLKDAFNELEKEIKRKDEKRQSILATWIHTWSSYLHQEVSFKPEWLIPYRRGMIVHLNMGFNVGSETGGARYAVVVENNNNPKNNTVTVIPLSSLSHGKTREKLHHSEVYLGKIIPDDNQTESYAKVLQIRAVSKLRIIKPRRKQHGIISLSSQQMDEIDEKIRECFTKVLDKSEKI